MKCACDPPHNVFTQTGGILLKSTLLQHDATDTEANDSGGSDARVRTDLMSPLWMTRSICPPSASWITCRTVSSDSGPVPMSAIDATRNGRSEVPTPSGRVENENTWDHMLTPSPTR